MGSSILVAVTKYQIKEFASIVTVELGSVVILATSNRWGMETRARPRRV